MSAAPRSSLVIETPEGISFSYELATPAARALAWAVDAAAIGTGAMVAGQASALAGVVSPDWGQALSALLYFVVSMGYGIVLEWRWRGQTLGKRLLGLRVVDAHGLRLRPAQIVVRNLMRAFDSLPLVYLVGGIAALVSRNCQRLGDLAANTVVARERKWAEPDLERIAPAKYNSLAAHPHIAARLRNAAAPEAVGIALRAVLSRDSFEARARTELFAELAAYFRSLAAFPEEAASGLSDEEYVRSALRVIYGGGTLWYPGGSNTL